MIPQSSTIFPSQNCSLDVANLPPEIILVERAAKPLTVLHFRRWPSRSVSSRPHRHSNRGSMTPAGESSTHCLAFSMDLATQSIDDRLAALFKNVHLSIYAEASQNQYSKEPIAHEDFPIAQFIRFLKHIKLKNILRNVADKRNPNKVTYTLHS